MNEKELKAAVEEAVEATKRYDGARSRLYPLVKSLNRALNSLEFDIGEIESWGIGRTEVWMTCGRSYRGEWGTEERSFPVEWLGFECFNEDGYGEGPDWAKLRDIVEARKKKAAEEARKAEEKARKAEVRRKRAEERKEYLRLKKKFEKE